MIWTIRARLALWYALAFFAVLLSVLSVLALELNRQLDDEIRHVLRTEQRWITALFEAEFLPLLAADKEEYEELALELHEELEERYGLKQQFALLAIKRAGETVSFSGGLKNVAQLLPVDFLERRAGSYSIMIATHRYRVRVFHRAWGVVAVGVENETVFKAAKEAGEMLVWILPLAMLLAVAGGWLLAKLALHPVVVAAKTAETISLTNLHERLPAYSGADEFGALVSTLNHMISRVEEGVKRLQQFTQDAAHELRTPLTILRGELELAYQNENATEEMRALLQRALDRAIALGQITESLMLLARSDSGDYPATKQLFRLDLVVQEIFEDLKILAEDRGLAVLLRECCVVEFFGDEALVRHLLMNLCDNALKYTSKGKIELSLRRSEHEIAMLVSDTGFGIPAEELPHIFDRFYRVEKARTSGSGSGLGLAICKWIVEAHDGMIQVASEVGSGTTVRVSLPLTSIKKIC